MKTIGKLKEKIAAIENDKGILHFIEKEITHTLNETSYTDITGQLRRLVDEMDTPANPPNNTNAIIHYLQDVYDGYFVMKQTGGETGTRLLKMNYTVTNDEVSVVGDAIPVRKQVDYINITNKEKKMERTKGAKDTPCCPDAVAGLIDNKDSKWTADDAEFLNTLSAEQLEKLQPVVVEKEVEPDTEDITDNQEDIIDNAHDENVQVTVEDYIASAPAEIQNVLNTGLIMQKEQKDDLVSRIMANKKSTFTKEMLEQKSLEELSILVNLAEEKPANFAGNSPAVVNTGEEVLEVPTMNWKDE